MTKSIFDLDEFKPLAARWRARQDLLARRDQYCSGKVYADARAALGFLGPRLGREIRPLYLPLARAVDLDAGIIPGGWKLSEDAAPFAAAVKQVLTWSDWRTDGMLFPRFGARFGTVGLKVCDLQDAGRVIVKPVSPDVFMLVESGAYDATPRLALVVERRTDEAGKEFEYAEVIEATRIRTFADGAPRDFDGRPALYPNVLEFVPFVECPHLNAGKMMGESTFENILPMLDEVNEMATSLAITIKGYKDPQFYATGADEADLKRGENVWLLPDASSKAGALVAPIDIGGVLAFVREIAGNVKAGLPELAFDELRSKQQIASSTVQLQLMELIVKINLVRPNYDHALATALRLAGRAGAQMKLSEVAGLDSDSLTFDSEREVIPLDPVSRAQVAKVTAEAQLAGSKIVEKAPSPA